MRKTRTKVLGLLVAIVFILVFVTGCAEESGEDVPEEVAEVAGGMFDILEVMFEDDPYLYSGLSRGVWTDTHRVLIATNYQPDYGVYVNGTAEIELLNDSPYTISVSVNYTISGQVTATVSLSGTATWASGTSPGYDEPSSYSGTFRYNGESWDIGDIIDALDD
jgi:hypothetical protein